jgi:hypothetical protein
MVVRNPSWLLVGPIFTHHQDELSISCNTLELSPPAERVRYRHSINFDKTMGLGAEWLTNLHNSGYCHSVSSILKPRDWVQNG